MANASFLHGVEVIELSTPNGTITIPSSSVIGLVGDAQYSDPTAFPLDTPVLVTNPTQAQALTANLPANAAAGSQGSLPQAINDIFTQGSPPVVVVRVETDTTDMGAAQITGQLANICGDPTMNTGCFALLTAQSLLGVKPKILCAPSYSSLIPAGAETPPVIAALQSVATTLRAVVIADGLNDTTAAMLALAPQIGNQRVYVIDPWPTILSPSGAVTVDPPSGLVAGLIANNDVQNGFWWSPSNQVIQGIVGTARPIVFGLSDPTAESNQLNGAGVATIINSGGFKLWGNRTGSTDPNWVFLAVRRTFDVIEDAVEAGYLWAMDRPFSVGLLKAVADELNAFLRGLKGKGAVIDGKAWLDPTLNTASTMQDGQFFVDFDAEPPAPLERLTFQAQRNGSYYTELLTAATAALSTTSTNAAQSSNPGLSTSVTA